MKMNYHTHTTWCDGKDTPEAVVVAAIDKGFDAIGFSSHAMLPEDDTPWVLTPDKCRTFPQSWVNPDSASVCPALRDILNSR